MAGLKLAGWESWAGSVALRKAADTVHFTLSHDVPQHERLNFKAKKIADKLGHKQALRRVAMVALLGKSKRQSAAQKNTKDRVQ